MPLVARFDNNKNNFIYIAFLLLSLYYYFYIHKMYIYKYIPIAVLLSYFGTYLLVNYSINIDVPSKRSSHKITTASSGGLAFIGVNMIWVFLIFLKTK